MMHFNFSTACLLFGFVYVVCGAPAIGSEVRDLGNGYSLHPTRDLSRRVPGELQIKFAYAPGQTHTRITKFDNDVTAILTHAISLASMKVPRDQPVRITPTNYPEADAK